MDADLFEAVQARLAQNLNRRDLRKGKSDALLTGCIFDDRGNTMSPSHAVKKGVRYRYYVSIALVQGRKVEAGTIARVPAQEIEMLVLDALRERLADGLPDARQGQRERLGQLGLRVDVHNQALEITWADAASDGQTAGAADTDDDRYGGERQRIIIPYVFNAHKRRREIVLPTTTSGYIRPIEQAVQQSLTRSIAQGRGWLKEIMSGMAIAPSRYANSVVNA